MSKYGQYRIDGQPIPGRPRGLISPSEVPVKNVSVTGRVPAELDAWVRDQPGGMSYVVRRALADYYEKVTGESFGDIDPGYLGSANDYIGSDRPKRPLFTDERAWERVKRVYDFTCLACGRREPEVILDRDHVIPQSLGGSNTADNIAPLCPSCNSRKGGRFVDFRPAFWAGVRAGQIVDLIPPEA